MASPGWMTQERWVVRSLAPCEGMAERKTRALHIRRSSLPSQELWDTHHLCLHLFIFVKSHFPSLLRRVALSPSILLKFSSTLPFLFLACSQSTDFFPLAANCEHVPTHSIKDVLFQKWHPVGGDAACPGWLFSFTGWDHTYWTARIYHTVKHLPTYAPGILNNNQEEFADARIRIQGGRGRGLTDLPSPHSHVYNLPLKEKMLMFSGDR